MSEPMSEARLAEIEARLQNVEPGLSDGGAWFCSVMRVPVGEVYSDEWELTRLLRTQQDGRMIAIRPLTELHEPEHSAREEFIFMAHARADVPDLLAEVKRLRALVNATATATEGPE